MKLLRGQVSKEKLYLLFELIDRLGEKTRYALEDHLCKGLREGVAASLNDLDRSNFRKSLENLRKKATIAENIGKLDHHKKES